MEGFRECVICGINAEFEELTVLEMMYGTSEPFLYYACSSCRSLQIAKVPPNLSEHYPENYYSMSSGQQSRGPVAVLKQRFNVLRDRAALGYPSFIGALMQRIRPAAEDLAALARVSPKRNSKILDVGCGGGAHFLRRLAEAGMTDLTGADPYIAEDLIHPNGVKVYKATLAQVVGTFDIITMNHSFEHVADPYATLVDASERLKPDGKCVIRVPTPSSNAFDIYRENWVQLDAPRHLNLPSRKGLAQLAERCGLSIIATFDDSGSFQFTGSELYAMGIPLVEASRHRFSPKDIRKFTKRANDLNRIRRGDQAVFILGKHD